MILGIRTCIIIEVSELKRKNYTKLKNKYNLFISYIIEIPIYV